MRMMISLAALSFIFHLSIASEAVASVGSFCQHTDETPVLVELVGHETTEETNHLRNTAKHESVSSVWQLQYSLRFRESELSKSNDHSRSERISSDQYDHLAEDILSFGAGVAAHSLCVSRNHEYELLLQWTDAEDVDSMGRSSRPAGASLCGGKYLVPIGRSILLSKGVLDDCLTAVAGSAIVVAEEFKVEDEGEDRRRLQDEPTSVPTVSPTFACIPTSPPSGIPTSLPTQRPSGPTSIPSAAPTVPTSVPTVNPTSPTSVPTSMPTMPTSSPTVDPNPEEEEGTNSGGGSSSGGGGATAFFQSDEGYGTIAAAGVVGLALLATGAYFLWQYSGDLVKAPLAPQELAMQI